MFLHCCLGDFNLTSSASFKSFMCVFPGRLFMGHFT